ncbi:Polycomb protein scmh1 [Saguinus oedipus]|uniref:Polycomb protein scmh1 n=1 Tax=Saguinus oedipus TaxID=9490 RepID=A0ABQ9VB13_SAGOE|nr:Polycomb protein scmh1 [Saguinus oedipus]
MSLFLAVVIPKNPYPASDVNTEKPSIHSSSKTVLEHQPGQRGRKPGKKRGRTSKTLISHPISAPPKTADLKFPKKRGPKPGSKLPLTSALIEYKLLKVKNLIFLFFFSCGTLRLSQSLGKYSEYVRWTGGWRKPRTLLNPPPASPTTSTPEPDTSTVPQDAATIPSSAMHAPTVCIYLNKNGSTGPHLDKKKIQQLPDHFGPARASVVLQQAVQACIDCAYHQKTVFSFLKQGHGGEIISGKPETSSGLDSSCPALYSTTRLTCLALFTHSTAVFDREQHTLNLPAVNSITYVLRFLEKLCHNLRSDNLFGNQPFTQTHLSLTATEYSHSHDRYLPEKQRPGHSVHPHEGESLVMSMESLHLGDELSRFSDPSTQNLHLSILALLRGRDTQWFASAPGETFILGNSLSRSLEPHSDSMNSVSNTTNLVSTSQRHWPLLPSCGLPTSTASAVRRLCSRDLGDQRGPSSVALCLVVGQGARLTFVPGLTTGRWRKMDQRKGHDDLQETSGPSYTGRPVGRFAKAMSLSVGPDRYLESRDASRLSGRDPSSWTVEDVMQFVREADPQLGPHADLFRKHEIDGKALLLLRSDMMMKYMGLKLGPALKLSYHIDRLKQGKF